jgi:glycosyltransferase involved in cell wall biosynthesis
MNIGINASILSDSKMDGFTRFSIGIIEELYAKNPQSYIYSKYKKFSFSLEDNLVRDIKGIFEYNSTLENISRLIWNQYSLPNITKKDSIKSVFSTTPEGTTFPTFNQYITIHDLIPIIYPESSPRLKYYYLYYLPRLIKACKGIFVTSHNTKIDLIKYYQLNQDKIYVIYQGYDQKTFYRLRDADKLFLGNKLKNKYSLDLSSRFILCVAESRSYKNLTRLIIAFSKLTISDLNLVIVGNKSKLSSDLEKMPNELGILKKVYFTGKVSDEELNYLYNQATVFAFPSLYEGFGIPPLEAMACGCPTIVSNASSLPEVCGDAAIYFNPEDTDSMKKSIESLLNDELFLKQLSFSGIERAKKFSYSKAAEKVLNVISSEQA